MQPQNPFRSAAKSDETLDSDSESCPAPPRTAAAYLFRVFSCDRPLASPARHDISGLAEVLVGRGDGTPVREDGRLMLRVPDPRISGAHARLRGMAEGFILEDLKSRNGTLVNGAPADQVLLRDGDWIECGRTFFRFRAELPGWEGCNPDAAPTGPTAELQTLSPTFAHELQRFMKVAMSKLPLVIAGETGAGKEVAARAAHALSGRRGAFVAVNCAALPATLVESELFGHRRGAFSGAVEDRPGLLRSADGGTVLLDEIGDLTPNAQASLLRALQERQVLPVGDTRPVSVDFRLIVAAQRPLEELVRAGRFRPDLLARAAGFTLHLPPLRDRVEDLGLLIGALLSRCGAPEGVCLAKDAARALLAHRFPLNVRELEKALEAALALAGHAQIEREHLPDAIRGAANATPSVDATPLPLTPAWSAVTQDGDEREHLVHLLCEHHGNISAIARAEGKERVQIRRWLRRYGLDPEQYRTK